MTLLTSVKSQLKKIPRFQKVIIACSGGVDSVVLAHVLKSLDYDIVLAHLNHQLRGEASDQDESFVQRLAESWKVPFESKKITISKKGNLENHARQVRYEFLESVRQKNEADTIALGHHQGDQLETILMHAMRGAGLRGLRGMQFVSGHLARPLLEISKKKVLDYAKENGLSYRTDKSNLDLSFTRNRWRHVGLPYLKAHFPGFEKKLLNLSRQASEKLNLLSAKAKQWLSSQLKGDHFDSEVFTRLSEDLQCEILIQCFGSIDVYENDLQKSLSLIRKNRSGSRTIIKNRCLSISHSQVYIQSIGEQQEPLDQKEMKMNQECRWGSWTIKNTSGKTLFVRHWEKGDRFHPLGMSGSKKLQDFFVDQKIPRHEREKIPVIVDEKNVIMAVAHLRVADGAEHLKTKLLIKKHS